jgi:hypothetical protein
MEQVSWFGYVNPTTDLELYLLGSEDLAAQFVLANYICSVHSKTKRRTNLQMYPVVQSYFLVVQSHFLADHALKNNMANTQQEVRHTCRKNGSTRKRECVRACRQSSGEHTSFQMRRL